MTSVHSALDPRIFHKECRSLARAGFSVTIVGPHSTELETRAVPKTGIADDVRFKTVHKDRSRLARITRTAWRVYREACRQQADIYHFHDPELILAGVLLRAKGKKVIYDIHEDLPKDILSKDYLPIYSRRIISWLVGGLEGTVCGHFSALVTATPSIAERFRRLNRRTTVVHNYPYQNEVIDAQQPSPWGARRQSVAYIGHINGIRAIREIVSAMSLLPESLCAMLELAGNKLPDDVNPDELYRHPGWARVRHHGNLDPLSAFRLLHEVRAGLVVFHPEPNHVEALPQKMFEYMGAGIPVIASDFPLWRRILGDARCGILVDPLDPRAIAQAIEFVLTHPNEAEEMGRRGQAAALEHYNWDTEAKKLVELYMGLSATRCAA